MWDVGAGSWAAVELGRWESEAVRRWGAAELESCGAGAPGSWEAKDPKS